MAALSLDPSLETLWPLCSHRTHSLREDLCRCPQEGFLRAVQVVLKLSACHVLQNSLQFIVQWVEVWNPLGRILGTDEGQKVPQQPLPDLSWSLGRN